MPSTQQNENVHVLSAIYHLRYKKKKCKNLWEFKSNIATEILFNENHCGDYTEDIYNILITTIWRYVCLLGV